MGGACGRGPENNNNDGKMLCLSVCLYSLSGGVVVVAVVSRLTCDPTSVLVGVWLWVESALA